MSRKTNKNFNTFGGIRICRICTEPIENNYIKCINNKCSVMVHTECFKLVTDVFTVDTNNWCKQCADVRVFTKKISKMKSEIAVLKQLNDILHLLTMCLEDDLRSSYHTQPNLKITRKRFKIIQDVAKKPGK